jgi:hypothetical protein
VSRKGKNRDKCKAYALIHGGGQHKHYGRQRRLLMITGLVSGIPLPGEAKITHGMARRRIGS